MLVPVDLGGLHFGGRELKVVMTAEAMWFANEVVGEETDDMASLGWLGKASRMAVILAEAP